MSSSKSIVFLSFAGLVFVCTHEAVADSPLWARMLSPKYRNAIYSTMPDPSIITIRTRIDLSSNELAEARLDVTFLRRGTNLETWEFSDLAQDRILELTVSDLHPLAYTRSGPYVMDDDPYEIRVELMRAQNSLDVEILELNKYPPPPAGVNEVRIDDDNNVLINGNPTLLFGSYLLTHDHQNYGEIVALGLNAARSTDELPQFEDLWFLAGAHVYAGDPSGLRSKVRAYREDPQTVAWYIADEPNEGNVSASDLREIYQIVKEEDPYHPGGWAGVLQTQPGDIVRTNLPDYEGCQDFIAIDAYPCFYDYTYLRNVTRNFEYLHDPSLGSSSFEFIDLPTWSVPQMFDQETKWRWPYAFEEKNMVYQFVTNGAKSFFPYSYQGTNLEMWQYFAGIIKSELESVQQAIFAPTKSGTSMPIDLFPHLDVSMETSDPDLLVWSYRQTQDKEFLFLVNTSNKWNEPIGTKVPGPKDKIISVDVTFHHAGHDKVQALVRDSHMPESYTLSSENGISVQLDGVNDQSTGVLVLERVLDPVEPKGLKVQTK